MFNYIGILSKSSSVSHSVTCNFLNSQSRLNLILAKRNIIEIYDITKDGLDSKPYLGIYGNIILLEAIRDNTVDNLFVLTEDMEWMILSYIKAKNEIVSIEKGCIKEDIGARQDRLLYAVDVNFDYIVISAYKNVFRVIYLKRGGGKDFKIRYDYDDALFLCPIFSDRSQFGLVKVINNYPSEQKTVFLDVFGISTTKQEITRESYSYDLSANPCISLIVSPKFGGMVVFYNNHLKYYHVGSKLVEKDTKTYSDRKFVAYTEIDRTRYIVADGDGNIYLLAYKDEKIIFQFLGEVNYVKSLAYLDNNFVFIGSDKGNSQLIRIIKKGSSNGTNGNNTNPFIEIIEEYDSLAPINDFTIMNSNSEESNTEILCISGVGKTCSLKTIRKGTSINLFGRIDIAGVRDIYIVDHIANDAMDIEEGSGPNKLMFIAYTDRTELYHFDRFENSINYFEDKHGVTGVITHYAKQLGKGIIHVTDKAINIYSQDMEEMSVSVPTIVEPVIVKYKKGYLYVYNKNNILLRYSIAELLANHNNPEILNDEVVISSFDVTENMLIYSTWNSNLIYILNINSKKVFPLCEYEEDAFISSLSFIKNDGIKFLFVALSNGKMLFYKLKSIYNT
jgi:hypothetical protein